LGALVSTWVHLIPFGFTWVHLIPFGFTWVHLFPLGCTRPSLLFLFEKEQYHQWSEEKFGDYSYNQRERDEQSDVECS
jgi:hypothetical protein